MFFGKKLAELRLKYAQMGIHKFAEKMEILPSNLLDIEHGYIPYPTEQEWMVSIAKVLDIPKENIDDEMELMRLWHDPFVMQKMLEMRFPSPFTHTADGKQLTKEKLISLMEYINKIVEEHNKKVDEYNKEHEEYEDEGEVVSQP